MKDELLLLTRRHVADLTNLLKSVRSASANRIRQKPVLTAGAEAARHWFDVARPALERAGFPADTVADFSRRFEDLLLIAGGQPAKNVYASAVSDLLTAYKTAIVHQIEIGSFTPQSGLSIKPYIEGLPVEEGDFLDEAQRCLSVTALRGCIVLGWCATVSRIQQKIEEIGFTKFSKATEEMAGKTTGRFKPFNKKLSVESLSELQRVFDTELLWVLEYLNMIDSNQHQRLRHCFDLRNHSAHPGLAPTSPENLYSFFSDITKIVLKNPKFELLTAKR